MKLFKSFFLLVALLCVSSLALAASHSIVIGWNAVTARVDGTVATIDHYEIWRSSGSATPSFFGDIAPATATSVAIAGFLEGSTYNFQVRAIAKNGVAGTLSAPISVAVVAPETTSPPDAPTGVTATVQ